MNLDDLLSQVKIDGSIDAKDFINAFLFSGDVSYLDDLKKDFKIKYVEPFSKKLKSINEKDIEKIFDPFGITQISSKDINDKVILYKKKIEEFLNVKLPQNNETNQTSFKNTKIASLIPEDVKKIEKSEDTSLFETFTKKIQTNFKSLFNDISKKINQKNDYGEQKNIGEDITIIDFSDDTKKFLKDLLLKDFLSKFVEKLSNQKSQKQENQSSGGLFGLIATGALMIIPAIISNINRFITFLGKLNETFKSILNLPSKIAEILTNEGLYKFDDFKAWFELRWEKHVIDPLKKLSWFDSLAESITKKWNTSIDFIKRITKFDDISAWMSLNIEKYISSPIKSGLDFLKNAGTKIEDTFNFVKNLFKNEGGLSFVSKAFETTFSVIKNLLKPFEIGFELFGAAISSSGKIISGVFDFLGKGFKLLETFFPFAFKLFKMFDKFLGPLALLIDPVIDAFSTLFDVWDNDNLSFLEKGIAVLTSFVVGFGDIFTFLGDILAKGITGLWSVITGKGWKTDNAVSEWMEKNLYQGKDSLGKGAGKAVAGYFENKNTPSAASLVVNPEESNEGKPTSPKIKPIKMNDGLLESVGTPIKMTLGKQEYQSAPDDNVLLFRSGGILDKSLNDIKNVIKDVHSSLLSLNKNILEKDNYSQPINITNNNNNNNNNTSNGNKEYLMEDTKDVIFNNRLSWWTQSEKIRATI